MDHIVRLLFHTLPVRVYVNSVDGIEKREKGVPLIKNKKAVEPKCVPKEVHKLVILVCMLTGLYVWHEEKSAQKAHKSAGSLK